MDSPRWSLQDLLRFLSTDAKIPLAVAMVPVVGNETDSSAKSIAELKKGGLDEIISNEDHRKAIINAAKRVLKKQGGTSAKRKRDNEDDAPAAKGKQGNISRPQQDFDKVITDAETDMTKLENITITINRAPYMLVFAMVHTVIVHQLSVASALSLAHAYISANAVSKGRSIGLIPEKHGEQVSLQTMLGGSTQPVIKVMGRDIPVVRQNEEDEFRAIDVKTLRDRYSKHKIEGADLYNIPIYTPEAAYGYIQRAFGKNLPAVVGACLITMKSWLEGEGTDEEKEARRIELDKQGYKMYVETRPEVPYGQEGWGKKGELSLTKILELRKKSREEHAQDIRNKMSDEDGKQLSIEEAIRNADPKSVESPIQEEPEESKDEGKTRAGKKARATSKITKDEQLALEETVGEDVKMSKPKGTPQKSKGRGRKGKQLTIEERVAD